MTIDTGKIVDYYIKRLSSTKWEVINQTDKGIQVKRIKKVKRLGLWVGLFLLPFWGIGFILWFLVLLDYVLQREKIIFVTIDQMIEQLKKAK